MEHRIYRVVQDRPGKMPLSYYSTDDIRDLCGFLQYFLDNADPKGLEALTIVTTAKGISKGRPFLEVTGDIIRKRTFEERSAKLPKVPLLRSRFPTP